MFHRLRSETLARTRRAVWCAGTAYGTRLRVRADVIKPRRERSPDNHRAIEATPNSAVKILLPEATAINMAAVKRRGIFSWSRRPRILLTFAAFAIVVIAIWEPVLRTAGWTLVVNEPVAPADVIVLSIASGGAGALEASDLVQSGVSSHVAVFEDPPSGEDHEFIRRGLPYEDAGARQIRQLASLGVTNVVDISRVDGTESEGRVLPKWCDQQHLRSIMVVATKDHSRRVRRVLERDMKGHQTQVTVQAASYSSFDPDRWWETHGGAWAEIVELQKLL